MAPWLQVLEAYMVQALLRTPAFHRGVEKVAKRVHRIRHGTPPEEMGGTKIDEPQDSSFLRHFGDEVQTQLGRAEARAAEKEIEEEGADAVWRTSRRKAAAEGKTAAKKEVLDEDADAVWRTSRRNAASGAAPKQGFIGEYVGALREQLKSGK